MPGWGLDEWGTGGWGSVAATGGGIGTAPLILIRAPLPNSINNAEDAVICVEIFDLDLLSNSTNIYVDDVLVFNGTTGFTAGFIGTNKVQSTVQTVKVTKPGGWGYDTLVKVRVVAQDVTFLTTDDTWTWRTQPDPVCYTGLTPLAVETKLLQPYTTYTTLDSVRELLIGVALNETSAGAANSREKAARVIYQQAYRTEVSTIQNPYLVRNETALDSTVCEQARAVDVDRTIRAQKPLFTAAIQTLQAGQLFGEAYAREFVDYLDSTIYHYRVSMAANLVLVAAAAELQA